MIFGNKTKSIHSGSGSGTWFAPRIYLVQTPHYSAEETAAQGGDRTASSGSQVLSQCWLDWLIKHGSTAATLPWNSCQHWRAHTRAHHTCTPSQCPPGPLWALLRTPQHFTSLCAIPGIILSCNCARASSRGGRSLSHQSCFRQCSVIEWIVVYFKGILHHRQLLPAHPAVGVIPGVGQPGAHRGAAVLRLVIQGLAFTVLWVRLPPFPTLDAQPTCPLPSLLNSTFILRWADEGNLHAFFPLVVWFQRFLSSVHFFPSDFISIFKSCLGSHLLDSLRLVMVESI